jgi:hypothetical protein
VHVHVDAAGQHQRPGRVDLPAAPRGPAGLPDPSLADAQVALARAARGGITIVQLMMLIITDIAVMMIESILFVVSFTSILFSTIIVS